MRIGPTAPVPRPARTRLIPRLSLTLGLIGLLLVTASLVSMTLGPVKVPLSNVAGIIMAPTGIEVSPFTRTEQLVIEQLRLPRIVVGMLVGMSLGVAGAVMQGLFRNPLADPGIIGVSAGGAVGAVLAIALGLAAAFPLATPLFALAGAIGAAFLVYGIALTGGRFSMPALLVAGIAVSAFLGAIISTVLVTVPANDKLREILFWLAGGLDARSWAHVRLSAPLILGGVLLIIVLSRDLNLLMIGDDDAGSMGVRVGVVRPVLIVAASLVTGVAVAVSGTIAFVGLVVPHMLRLLVGPDNRVLVPASAVGGALFLVVADTVARTVVQPAELRVGIVTSLIGAPFFVFLLIRHKRRIHAF